MGGEQQEGEEDVSLASSKSSSESSSESSKSSSETSESSSKVSWESYINESTDNAIRSARSLQHSSKTHLRSLRDLFPWMVSQYKSMENSMVDEVKAEFVLAKQNPPAAAGIALSAALLLFPGPRRFLIRNTFGRFRSEEAQFVRAEKNVKELRLSVEVMRNESRKLLQRASLAHTDMKVGHTDLMNAGGHIRSLAKSVYKAEAQATDLMDLLREIPGRDALKLRADVASMASYLREQRIAMDRKIMRISELGVAV